ncbi:MAG: OmpH family outer membrane protein [Myxococcota bacterium]
MTTRMLGVSVLTAWLVAGCAQPRSEARPGAVAVVDLERVAKELGRDQTMLKELQGAEQTLQGQLGQLRDQFSAQIQQAIDAAGKSPTPEQQARITAMRGEAQKRLDQEVERARSLGQAKRQDVTFRFHTEVKPVVRRVAMARGAGVVLTRNDGVFDVDPTSDITDDVIAEMRRMEAAAPPAPAQPAQPQAAPTPQQTPPPAQGTP